MSSASSAIIISRSVPPDHTALFSRERSRSGERTAIERWLGGGGRSELGTARVTLRARRVGRPLSP
jgi:hypothetical protein